jgi:hypothetical protein
MTTHHGEAKTTPTREGDVRTAQEARTARDRQVALAPLKDERDGELYNLPFTD